MDSKENQRIELMLQIEHEKKNLGYKYIAGIDEAGRGPLCSPVVVASVILPDDIDIEGINDSKKLTEKKRELLYDKIIEKAISYNIQIVDVDKIEELNILGATKYGMKKCAEELSIKPDYVLIDGNQKIDINIPFETVVSGDSKSLSIAAASILAKVTRDRMLVEIDSKYPEYGFKNHKGYGTKKHVEAILKYGMIEGIHRPSFCKKILEKKK